MPFQYPEIISERLRTYKLHLKNFGKDVDKIRLLTICGTPIKKSLMDIVERLITEIDTKIDLIESIDDKRLKTNISKSCILSIEEFIDFGEKILNDFYHIQSDHRNVGSEIYFFIQNAVDDFEYPVSILIGRHPSLRTFNFWDIMRLLLSPFTDTIGYIDDKKNQERIWIIQVPQSLLRNPLHWSLILHEIGHIFEREYIKATDLEFERVKHDMEELTRDVVITQMKHAREYQADIFAATYIGPVFSIIMNLNFYTSEINMPGTHPDWEERLNKLTTGNLKQLINEALGKEYPIKGYDGTFKYRGSSLLKADNIIPLKNILIKTIKFVNESGNIYSYKDFEKSFAKKAIENLLPNTRNIKYALNAACIESVYSKAKELLEKHLKKQLEGEKIERDEIIIEFNRLLADTIRLTYISNHHRKWAPVIDSQQRLDYL